MASIVKIKRSSIQGKSPTTSTLETGEIAINIRDGKIFSSDGSRIVELGANSSSASFGTATFGNTNITTFDSSSNWYYAGHLNVSTNKELIFDNYTYSNQTKINHEDSALNITQTNSSAKVKITGGAGLELEGKANVSSVSTSTVHFPNTGIISANADLTILLDSDNNDTSANFTIKKNTSTKAGGTELFKVFENGTVRFNNTYTFPNSDGSSGQALITDGSGGISFGSVASSDELDDILSRNSQVGANVFFNGETTANNFFVEGDLVVRGNVTTISSEELNVDTNFIVLNANLTSSIAPLLDAGIEINRGSSANTKLYWDESGNRWHVTYGGGATPTDRKIPITLDDVLDNGFASNNAMTVNGITTLADARVTELKINSQYNLPGSYGASGTVLASHGNGSLYWVASNNELRTSTQFTSFKFTANTDQTTFDGNDDTNQLLRYEIGRQNVFLNGIRLISGVDYTATSGTSIVFTDAVANNDVVSIDAYGFTDQLQVGNNVVMSTADTTTTGTTAFTLDSFTGTDFVSAQYFVSAANSTAVHTTTVNLAHVNSTVYITEYGTIISGPSLMTLDADISSGTVRLRATPASSGIDIKSHRITFRA